MDPQSYLIHDRDIRDVVNELRAAGAEAVTVNGQRITVSSSIRCAGPIVLINQDEMATPFIIQAIGDPDKLLSALNIRNGVLDQIRTFGSDMAHAEKKSVAAPARLCRQHPYQAMRNRSPPKVRPAVKTRSESRSGPFRRRKSNTPGALPQ